MIKVEHLTKIYHSIGASVPALLDVSIEVPNKEILAIIGKNGSGKSTLLQLMGLLDHPTEGRIILDGRNVAGLAERDRSALRLSTIGFVFQQHSLLPELNAWENVALPAIKLGLPGYKKKSMELLEMVGLGDKAKAQPYQLSRGQEQRVTIARALINGPQLVLADEPTANLDPEASKLIMETFGKLNTELGVTIVFVTNDPNEEIYARKILILDNGRITAQGKGGKE